MTAAYLEDTYKPTDWLSFAGGVRQTHFSGSLTENATSPRLGLSVLLPKIDWILRGFWGKYYQAPPLTTLSGPLLEFAQANNCWQDLREAIDDVAEDVHRARPASTSQIRSLR